MIDKLAWIRIENGRMLCVRSRGKDVYFVPGGKREAGESDEAALVREISEELSVALRPETLRRAGIFEAPAHGRDGTVVRLTCFSGDYAGELRCAAEIEEMAWLTRADRERMSLVTQIVADALL